MFDLESLTKDITNEILAGKTLTITKEEDRDGKPVLCIRTREGVLRRNCVVPIEEIALASIPNYVMMLNIRHALTYEERRGEVK